MTLDPAHCRRASVKGEFEKRFKADGGSSFSRQKPAILFIDEAHTLIGAGNQQGGLDISTCSNSRHWRARTETIAATTGANTKNTFEKDAALLSRAVFNW